MSYNFNRFEGKTVLVVGAGAGMGEATALQFATEGANVVALDLFEDRLERLKEQAASLAGNITPYQGDLCNLDVVNGAIALIQEKFGSLDVLAYVAGIVDNMYTPEEMDEETWDRVQNINLKGAWRFVKAAAPLMKNHEGDAASIVMVSSVGGGYVYTSSGCAYISSKAGIEALMRNLAFVYQKENIRVNAVAPGSTMSEIGKTYTRLFPDREMKGGNAGVYLGGVLKMYDMENQFCQSSDMADAICFLSSQQAKHITGVSLKVDAGWTAF